VMMKRELHNTKNKLDITRVASKIMEEELQNAGLYDKVWQAYAAVGDDKAVGVVGDERKYSNIVHQIFIMNNQ